MYKARDTANHGQMVALKKVRVPLTEEGVPMSTLREISLLKQMEKYEHPNIVRSVLHYSGRYRVLPSFTEFYRVFFLLFIFGSRLMLLAFHLLN